MCLSGFKRQSGRVGVGDLNEREKVGESVKGHSVFRESSSTQPLLPNRC